MGDITRNKHRNNPASVAAYERSLFTQHTDRIAVYDIILSGTAGVTSKEIGKIMNKPIHKISGRISQLRADGLIRGTGVRRDGAEVLVACAEMEKTA